MAISYVNMKINLYEDLPNLRKRNEYVRQEKPFAGKIQSDVKNQTIPQFAMGDFSKRPEVENLRILHKERPSYPALLCPKTFKEKRHSLGTIFLKRQKEKHRPGRVKSHIPA